MDVSAVSGPVHVPVAKPATDATEAAENWGPDDDGDADDTGLTVKPFTAPVPGQPAGGGGVYL